MRGRNALPIVAGSVRMGVALSTAPTAHADNKRLNDGVVANVYTIQRQAGCTNDLRIDLRLQLAAEWHTNDVLRNRALNGDIGSDGSTTSDSSGRGRVSRRGRRNSGDQPGLGNQRDRTDQSVVPQPALPRDHARLQVHRDRGLVGEQRRPHRGGGRLWLTRMTNADESSRPCTHRPTENGPIGVHTRDTGFPTRAQPVPIAV